MATIKFLLQSKSDNAQIYLRLSLSQTRSLKKKTGFCINFKDWSEATSRPKQTTAANKALSNDLTKLQTYVFDNLNSDLAKGSTLDSHWLENLINQCFGRINKTDNSLLTTHIQHIIDNANTRKIQGSSKLGISESRIKSYQTFKKVIEEFQIFSKKQFHFTDVNKSFVDRFTNWLINAKKYSINYAGKQVDNLKTVCLDAEKLDIPVNAYVKQIQGFKENDEDRFIITLSFAELDTIRDIELKSSALDNARNYLLIGCELGQRASDLLNITKDDIRYKNGKCYLDIIQQKTGKHVTVPIIAPHVVDILENRFPYKISSQKLNEYIKEVCRLAGLTQLIDGKKFDDKTKRKIFGKYPKYQLVSSHSFRRTFATNYYKLIPTAILIGITAHSKESLFLQYIQKREDKDANADMFMQFYEQINKTNEPQLKIVS